MIKNGQGRVAREGITEESTGRKMRHAASGRVTLTDIWGKSDPGRRNGKWRSLVQKCAWHV